MAFAMESPVILLKFVHLYLSILEEASRNAGLSKREATMLILLRGTEHNSLTTNELGQLFHDWGVSSNATAAKDVSIAKKELFRTGLVIASGSTKNVALTAAGQVAADNLQSAIREGLHRAGQKSGIGDLVPILQSLQLPGKPVDAAAASGASKKKKKN
jgi:hypothetical protein